MKTLLAILLLSPSIIYGGDFKDCFKLIMDNDGDDYYKDWIARACSKSHEDTVYCMKQLHGTVVANENRSYELLARYHDYYTAAYVCNGIGAPSDL